MRELLRYREPALLAIALACLAALIIIRVRRRRAARRDSGLRALEAGAVRGRHAVGGPAGFGEIRTARPDFGQIAVMRGGGPDPAKGGRGPGARGPGDRAVDEPGLSGPSPDGPMGGHVPAEEAPAENGAPAGSPLPGTLRAWGLERGDNGIRAAPAGPPWEPAEEPPGEPAGEPPWDPTDPWTEDGDENPPRPDDVTNVPPPWPDGR